MVVAVRLVQIHVVGLEPAQRAVHGLEDVLAGQATVVGPGAGRPVHLREDLDRLTPHPVQRPAHHLLRAGPRVHVGGVEGGDSLVERCRDAGLGGVLLYLRPVGDPVSVGDLADHEAAAAQMTMLHASDPNGRALSSREPAGAVRPGTGFRCCRRCRPVAWASAACESATHAWQRRGRCRACSHPAAARRRARVSGG